MAVEDTELNRDDKHPRRRNVLIGHSGAERQLFDAYCSGKMHHAWILGGPPGIGKATLAYRFAKFILANPDPGRITGTPGSLAVPPDHPSARRAAMQGHADLLTIAPIWDPKTKKFKREIGAEQARRATGFFSHTAGEGGWRICVVDPADQMSITAANALLKILEEPPERAIFLLVADIPGRLMATVRSRCLRLNLLPLEDTEVYSVLEDVFAADNPYREDEIAKAAQIAAGSPGRAIKLLESGTLPLFDSFLEIIATSPQFDQRKALVLSERLGARSAGDQYDLFFGLLLDWIAEQASDQIVHQTRGRGAGIHPGRAAQAYDEISRSLRRANGLNLDKQQVIIQALTELRSAVTMPA